ARRHRRLHRQLRGDCGPAAARGARRARPGRQGRRATLRAPTAAGLPRDRPGARPGGTRSQPRLTLMASEVGGEQRCGTGARLRAAREQAGLSLAQAAESLALDPPTLEALEAEDFAALGADVYVRGHLRRYAELIGESPAQLQELYARSAPALQPRSEERRVGKEGSAGWAR